MKWLLYSLVALIAGAALAIILHNDPGYVLMRYGPWSIEMSLAVLAFLATAASIVGYWIITLIGGLTRLPARSRNWRKRRRLSKANAALAHAIVDAAEGNYAKAERGLIAHVANSQHANIYYLLAARYAFAQEAYNRVDDYIALATAESVQHRLAAFLTDGELKIRAGQYELALSPLRQAKEYAPTNLRALVLLAQANEGLKDWNQLAALLPELERSKALKTAELARLEQIAYAGVLERAAQSGESEAVRQAWARIPKAARENPELLRAYEASLKTIASEPQ